MRTFLIPFLIGIGIRFFFSVFYHGASDPVNAKAMIEAMMQGYDPYLYEGIPYSPLGVALLHLYQALSVQTPFDINFWMEAGAIWGDALSFTAIYLILSKFFKHPRKKSL